MSSSGKFPDWSVFGERELPFTVDLLSPASEVAALLQLYRNELDRAQEETDKVQREWVKALALQAVFIFHLETALKRYEEQMQGPLAPAHRQLRILKDQMKDAICRADLEILVPQDLPFDAVADWVQVVGWRHREDFKEEVVAEVLEPIVTRRGGLVRLGRVIMGGPPPPPEPEAGGNEP